MLHKMRHARLTARRAECKKVDFEFVLQGSDNIVTTVKQSGCRRYRKPARVGLGPSKRHDGVMGNIQ